MTTKASYPPNRQDKPLIEQYNDALDDGRALVQAHIDAANGEPKPKPGA